MSTRPGVHQHPVTPYTPATVRSDARVPATHAPATTPDSQHSGPPSELAPRVEHRQSVHISSKVAPAVHPRGTQGRYPTKGKYPWLVTGRQSGDEEGDTANQA